MNDSALSLWAVVHKGKSVSSMANEDCIEYRDSWPIRSPESVGARTGARRASRRSGGRLKGRCR